MLVGLKTRNYADLRGAYFSENARVLLPVLAGSANFDAQVECAKRDLRQELAEADIKRVFARPQR